MARRDRPPGGPSRRGRRRGQREHDRRRLTRRSLLPARQHFRRRFETSTLPSRRRTSRCRARPDRKPDSFRRRQRRRRHRPLRSPLSSGLGRMYVEFEKSRHELRRLDAVGMGGWNRSPGKRSRTRLAPREHRHSIAGDYRTRRSTGVAGGYRFRRRARTGSGFGRFHTSRFFATPAATSSSATLSVVTTLRYV